MTTTTRIARPARGARAACAMLALLAIAPLNAAQAQVLQQVPSDSLVVIKINKLKAASDKFGAMSKKLGIDEFQPALLDPLGAFRQSTNVKQGLDEAGDAAIVIPNAPMDPQNQPVILLLPVTDYQAFLKNFPDAKTQGAISTMRIGTNRMDSYAANWGKYAAISTRRELIAEEKPDGLAVQGLSAKELQDKDAVAYVNMKQARSRILPALSKARGQVQEQFEKAAAQGQQPGAGASTRPAGAGSGGAGAAGAAATTMPAGATQYLPVVRAVITRVFDTAERVVTDADAATYGISIQEDGIRTTSLAEFAKGSPSATRVAELKGSSESLLAGLPAAKYMFFGGAVNGGKTAQQLLSDFITPIEQAAAGLGAEGKPIASYFDALRKYASASQGSSFGWIVPTGALGQDAILQMVTVMRGDAKTVMQAQRQMFESQQAVMEMFSPPQARTQVKTTFTDNAKTIDGVALQQFSTQFTPPAGRQTPQQMQMQQMMMFMYGPNGMSGYTGAVGDDKVVFAMGVNDQVLQQLVASAKAGTDEASKQPALAGVRKHLPQARLAEGYFALDQLVSTVARYAAMFGMPVAIELPQDLPPIGMTVGTEGTAVRGDSFIPAQLVQSLVAAFEQMRMNMQQGGPGQGGQPGAL